MEKHIITIQKWFRGNIYRLNHLPLILYKIRNYLLLQKLLLSNKHEDGRINSSIDENIIIDIIIKEFGDRIKKPKIRMWYDILIFDYIYGWLPVNIKTTTTLTNDNTGNLSMCVYSYTNENLNIYNKKSYENSKMSDILFNKIKNKEYNKNNKKDYYFIVINKNNSKDIIINSLKGLTILSPNINNLPFQICWNKNRNFKYENIQIKIKSFIECLQKPKPSWKEIFMENMRSIQL
jgi:hypothetical protein